MRQDFRPSGRLASLIAAAVMATLTACAAAPQDDGSCKISCSKPAIGSSTYRVQKMIPVSETYTCTGDTGAVVAPNRPIMVAFRIVQATAGLSSTNDPFPAADEATEQPVPGVAFEPVVKGAMNTLATNPEHLTTNANGEQVASPAKFEGVVTPQSEWCSDSCGVMRYEIAPVCIVGSQNDVSAGVFAGAADVPDYYTFPITGATATDAATE
jgi:hypothetical protein